MVLVFMILSLSPILCEAELLSLSGTPLVVCGGGSHATRGKTRRARSDTKTSE